MKKTLVFMLFLVMASGWVNSQTVVKLMLPDNCSANVSTVENLNTATGSTLAIFPNPNNGSFSLNVSFEDVIGQAEIRIYNSMGKTVYSEIIYCDSEKYITQLHLNNLNAGTYIFIFKNTAKEISTKLLIK